MRNNNLFDNFFQGQAWDFLNDAIRIAFEEDGPDLASRAVFGNDVAFKAVIVAKEPAVMAGGPLLPIILKIASELEGGDWTCRVMADDGVRVGDSGEEIVAEIVGSAALVLRAERIILNFICHMSGIATLTRRYVDAIAGRATILDTRKTLPGLRYPEKYAVLAGGGKNHRRNLSEMLMLKDNHIDAASGVKPAVEKLRQIIASGCPPIEVECRNLTEVADAVACRVDRIMLDNMDRKTMSQALDRIPLDIEIEISGGVRLDALDNVLSFGSRRQPDYISVGRLTHSAPASDFSMRILPL